MRASSLKREMWATCAAIINLTHLHHFFSKWMSELFYCISDWTLHRKLEEIGLSRRSEIVLESRSEGEPRWIALRSNCVMWGLRLFFFIVRSCKDCKHSHIHTNGTETFIFHSDLSIHIQTFFFFSFLWLLLMNNILCIQLVICEGQRMFSCDVCSV